MSRPKRAVAETTKRVDSALWEGVSAADCLEALLAEFLAEQVEKGLAKPGLAPISAEVLRNGRLRIYLNDDTYVELFTFPASLH